MGVYNRWTSKRNNIVKPCRDEKKVNLKESSRNLLNQLDNKKPEELESEFDHFDVDNLCQSSPFKGCNIVDLDFVYKQ